jgi:prepilin-type N-terminal cleavage/methylation domain-containing protein
MKIKAFTLVEMIVALAISATLTAVTYYAFSAVQRVSTLKMEQLTGIEKMQELRFLLEYDFSTQLNWEWDASNNILATQDGSLSYEWQEKAIKRQSGEQITIFKLDKLEWTLKNYEGEQVVAQLNLLLREQEQDYSLRFSVNKEASYRINKMLNSGN